MKTLRSNRNFACLVALVAAVALAVGAPVASAQTSQGGYTPPGSNAQAEIQSTPSTPTDRTAANATTTVQRSGSSTNGALPFTGLDLGLVGLAGVVLVLVGFSLRRMTLRGAHGGHNAA